MNRFLTALLVCAASIACTQDALTSPQEVVLIVETNIRLSEHNAMVAVRGRNIDPPEALVHVSCEGTDVTLIARQLERTEEACGLQFELSQLRITEGVVNAAVLKLHFDDGRSSDLPLGEGSGSGETAGGSSDSASAPAAVPAEESAGEAAGAPAEAPSAVPADSAAAEPAAVPAVEAAAVPAVEAASQPTATGVTTTQPAAGLIAGDGSGGSAGE